ncbi:MAG: GNAT family N-acetyltransferase [Anaerolineae bacterium]|nr:GNAT family N-acetyltransferase [Anaerolineae bacterium]
MRIRPARIDDAPGIAHVHVTSWRSAYAGIIPQTYLDDLSETRRAAFWTQQIDTPEKSTFIVVAEDDSGQIVGMASGGPERLGVEGYTGEIYLIYLLADAQGQGIGRKLIHTSARHLLEAGFNSMMLWVLEDNHRAQRFYEAMGGQKLDQTQPHLIGGKVLIEISYGWPDIDLLAEKAEPGGEDS